MTHSFSSVQHSALRKSSLPSLECGNYGNWITTGSTFSLVRFSKTLSKKICISRLYIFGSFCSSFFRACLKSFETDRSSVFISKSSSCQSVVQMKIYGWVWPLSHNVVFLPPMLPPVLVVALLVIRLCRVYRDCLADDLYFWNSSVWSSFSRSMVRRFKIVWTEVAIGRYDGRTKTSLLSDFLSSLLNYFIH